MEPVHVIGGGLAGSEAAWQAARTGVPTENRSWRARVLADLDAWLRGTEPAL